VNPAVIRAALHLDFRLFAIKVSFQNHEKRTTAYLQLIWKQCVTQQPMD